MGGSSAGWVGLELWSPPPLLIPRVSWVGLQPPLLSLVTGALSSWLLVPLSALSLCRHQRVKKCVFTPCVYTPYTRNFQENSIIDKNGHFSSHPKIMISSLTVCLSKMSSILVGRTLHTQLQDPGFSFSGWHVLVIAQKWWSCFPFFFPMAHHETNLQRQGYVANLVHRKCPPQNYKRGGGLGGSKVGWVGLVQNTPPPYKRSLPTRTSRSGG